jgi:hypothetical protein
MTLGGLFEDLEKHDHHEADHEPEGKIFVKRTHLTSIGRTRRRPKANRQDKKIG